MRGVQKSLFRFLWSGDIVAWLKRWIWEGPQTFLGFIVAQYFILTGKVLEVERSEGVLVFVTKGRWGAVSLGQIIIGDEKISPVVGNHLFMHEFGHSIQSRRVGPLYLLIYGLPSLVSVILMQNKHHTTNVERYANRLAYKYFNKRYSLEYWDRSSYPFTKT